MAWWLFKTSHAPRDAVIRSATTWNPNEWLRRENGRVLPLRGGSRMYFASFISIIRNPPEAARGATNRQTACNKATSIARIARYQVTSYAAEIRGHMGTGPSTALNQHGGKQPPSRKVREVGLGFEKFNYWSTDILEIIN